MRARWHFFVTFMTCPFVFILTRSYFALVLWFFFGFFLDLDHELEYILREGKVTFSAYELSNLPYDVLLLPLHCLEWVPLAFLVFHLILPQWVIVPSIYLTHMLMDVIDQRSCPLHFFGVYRLWKWKNIGKKLIKRQS